MPMICSTNCWPTSCGTNREAVLNSNPKPITPKTRCLTCGPGRSSLHPNDHVHPGFGKVELRCDGLSHFSTVTDYEITLADIERRVKPKRRAWTLVIHGPMVKRTYRRLRGGDHWILIAEEDGFA